MFEHRFREYFTSQVAVAAATADSAPAFVACPCSLFAASTPAQANITEIYRIARELTQAQLRQVAPARPARAWPPAFSAN